MVITGTVENAKINVSNDKMKTPGKGTFTSNIHRRNKVVDIQLRENEIVLKEMASDYWAGEPVLIAVIGC